MVALGVSLCLLATLTTIWYMYSNIELGRHQDTHLARSIMLLLACAVLMLAGIVFLGAGIVQYLLVIV